jgi:putative ABC transport system permease protein
VEFVFAFCMLTGIAVLYAAMLATDDERRRETSLLRVLGASRRDVLVAVLAEFAGIGLLAGIVAALASSGLAWFLATEVLHIPFHFNPGLVLVVIGTGLLFVPLAAWLGLARILQQHPRQVLQSA